LGIAEARKIKEHLSLKPYSAKGIVIILEDASVMTPEAQNALLKTLEELAKEALKESEGLEAIVEKEEGREKAEQKAEEYSNKAQDKTEGEGSAEKDGDKEMAEAGTGGNQASE